MKISAVYPIPVLRIAYLVSAILFTIVILAGCAMPEIDFARLIPGGSKDAVSGDMTGLANAPAVDAQAQPTPTEIEEPKVDVQEPGAVEDITGSSPDLSGMVLFTSRAADPLAASDAGRLPGDSDQSYLWAVSVDGMRAGRLSPEGFASALEPASLPEKLPLVLAYGMELSSSELTSLVAPDECLGGVCSDFKFGLQGRTYAYLSGEENCGRTLTLIERANGQVLNTWQGVSWFYFNRDGGLLLAQGDCTKRYVYQYIPNTDQQAGMSPDGEMIWDPSRQAALVQVSGESPAQSGLWGFNTDTSSVILWTSQEPVMQDTPIWLADGRHFVYQHRFVHYDKESGNATLDGPRQVILMDAWTRSQKLVVFQPGYDFHLCPSEGQPCEQPYGDWLKVRRTTFQQGGLLLGDPAHATIARCALFGLDCTEPAEEFAVNWKTGEVLPWADAGLPSPEPSPAFQPPDLAGQPVYADPAGAFWLYTSVDKHTLWYVPAQGDPVLWVIDGENFVYLP